MRCILNKMRIPQETQKTQIEKKCFQRFFDIDVPDSNTFLVSLELILVSAGDVALEDGRGDSVQPGLAFISDFQTE